MDIFCTHKNLKGNLERMIKIGVFQNKETKRYFSSFNKQGSADTVSKPEYAKAWVLDSYSRKGNLNRFKKQNNQKLESLGFEYLETEVQELL